MNRMDDEELFNQQKVHLCNSCKLTDQTKQDKTKPVNEKKLQSEKRRNPQNSV